MARSGSVLFPVTMRLLPILITLALPALACTPARAQCSVQAYWVNAPIASGTLTAQGVIPANDTVTVRSTGSYAAGRPIYWGTTYVYLGKNYSSLHLSRGNSFGTGNRTSFKLAVPLDSNRVHIRVSDIRGDGFNTESQRVQGWLNGTAVAATFTDPVNGATLSGGNVIVGASTTTSTVQSAMRAHFNGAVDSITVTATGFSDYVIIELMAACDLLLPDRPILLQGRTVPEGNLLWCDVAAVDREVLTLQRSADGRQWEDLRSFVREESVRLTDPAPGPGRYRYRLRLQRPDGAPSYSNLVALGAPLAEARWSVHPNPSTDIVFLDGPDRPTEVRCHGMDGALLRTWRDPALRGAFDIAGLPSGILLFRAWLRDGSVVTTRVWHQ